MDTPAGPCQISRIGYHYDLNTIKGHIKIWDALAWRNDSIIKLLVIYLRIVMPKFKDTPILPLELPDAINGLYFDITKKFRPESKKIFGTRSIVLDTTFKAVEEIGLGYTLNKEKRAYSTLRY